MRHAHFAWDLILTQAFVFAPFLRAQPPLPPAASPAPGEQASRKLDRWLSRTEATTEPKSEGIAAVLGDTAGMGGLSACCHLIKLLEPQELLKVKEVLVASMMDKGLSSELVEAPKMAAPEIPADANEATKKLGEVLASLTQLSNEAAEREQAAVKALKKAEEDAKAMQAAAKKQAAVASSAAAGAGAGEGGGEGGGKMNRWIKRAEQKAAEPKGEEEAAPAGKLGRWLKRAENKPTQDPEVPTRVCMRECECVCVSRRGRAGLCRVFVSLICVSFGSSCPVDPKP